MQELNINSNVCCTVVHLKMYNRYNRWCYYFYFFGHFPPAGFSFLLESSSVMFCQYKTVVEVVCMIKKLTIIVTVIVTIFFFFVCVEIERGGGGGERERERNK